MIKKIIEKPIDIDVHFKYRCPKCVSDHWISLNEARTKGFKVVCDCKCIFSPKRISKIQIVYGTKHKPKKQLAAKQTVKTEPQDRSISSSLLNQCLPILIKYGFTKTESQDLLSKAYKIEQTNDCGQLVKLALKSLGVTNE